MTAQDRLSLIRICIITPIISKGFRNDGPIQSALPEGCTLSQRFLDRGPASVESAVDEVLAGPGVVDAALAAEAEGAQALIVDCMLDPGLDAAREAVSIPVLGCGETAFRHAAAFGPFTVVTVLERQARAFRTMARLHGLGDSLRNVRSIDMPVLALERDAERAFAATLGEARKAIDQDGAHAVVFGCTGMLGFGEKLAGALDRAVEVVDPLPLAIGKAYETVRRGEVADKALYPTPERKRVAGFDEWSALSRVLRPEGTR